MFEKLWGRGRPSPDGPADPKGLAPDPKPLADIPDEGAPPSAPAPSAPVGKSRQNDVKTGVFPAFRPAPPSAPVAETASQHLRVSDSYSRPRPKIVPNLSDLKELQAKLLAKLEAGELSPEISRHHLHQALADDQRDPIRGLQAAKLLPCRSAPIRTIVEQLERLARIPGFAHLEGNPLPSLSREHSNDYPEGLVVLPRIFEHPLGDSNLSKEDAQHLYVDSLNATLELLRQQLPGLRYELPFHLTADTVKPHGQTIFNVLGTYGTFGHVKLMPVQLGRRHLGSAFRKTLRSGLLPEECGLDLYTAAIYLMTHADLVADLAFPELPCAFTCDGLRLTLPGGLPLGHVPMVRFLPSREIEISPVSVDRFEERCGSATIFNPQEEFLSRIFF